MQTAIVKIRIGSPKMVRDEQVYAQCAPKVIQEVNFPKRLWGLYARDGW